MANNKGSKKQVEKDKNEEKIFLYVDSDSTKAYGDETDLCSLLGTAFLEFVDAGTITTRHAHILLDYLEEMIEDKENDKKSKSEVKLWN